jgi:hypothetical protein
MVKYKRGFSTRGFRKETRFGPGNRDKNADKKTYFMQFAPAEEEQLQVQGAGAAELGVCHVEVEGERSPLLPLLCPLS